MMNSTKIYPESISDLGTYIEALVYGTSSLVNQGVVTARQAHEIVELMLYAKHVADQIGYANRPPDDLDRLLGSVTVREVI